ncbi:MAG: CRTAC1 family protein [Deltaproteobacteria bacterium]|nr:CRTAC1 family protein [Deltaproteobacteria bacterium]
MRRDEHDARGAERTRAFWPAWSMGLVLSGLACTEAPIGAPAPHGPSTTSPTPGTDGTEPPMRLGRPTDPGVDPGAPEVSSWGPLASLPDTRFMDVTRLSGVHCGHADQPDYYTTGQAFADVNGDGVLDLYVTNTHGSNYLYEGNGDGTFRVSRFLDQVALDTAISGGAIFADVDDDGDPDLYVLNLGPNVLFRNDGDAGFTDITETSGLGDPGKGQSAAFADYDNDGDLDLYLVNWWCVECQDMDLWHQATDRLFENRGQGRFRDMTTMLGVEHTDGSGYAAVWFDYDADGDPDLYVANDKGFDGPRDHGLPMNRNVLYRNDGPGCHGWCFTERAEEAGVDLRMEAMGLAVGDVDGDLDLDLFVTNTGQPKLLLNRGDTRFEEVAVERGIVDENTSWGTVLFDYDNDGDLDLYFAVGVAYGLDNPNRLFDNDGRGRFTPVPQDELGAEYPRHTVGVAMGDVDADGGLDLVVGGSVHGYRVFGNLTALRAERHYTRVRLVGGGGVNRDAVGTRVYLTRTDGVLLMQEVHAGSSNGSGHDLALHFGLGEAEVALLEVWWPDGTQEVVEGPIPVDTEWSHRHPDAR